MLIRTATADDWPQVWPLVREVAAAGETYALERDLTEADAHGLWAVWDRPRSVLLVAVGDEEPGTVLGAAKVVPNSRGPGAHVANGSYVVAPAAGGRGVGRALGERTLAWAREAGFRAMQFNSVVETNTHAVRLWQSLGFVIVGTVPGAFAHPVHGDVGLHVMHRAL